MRKNETEEDVRRHNEPLMTKLSKKMFTYNFTIEEVAKQIGCHKITIMHYLNHKRKVSRRIAFRINEWLLNFSCPQENS